METRTIVSLIIGAGIAVFILFVMTNPPRPEEHLTSPFDAEQPKASSPPAKLPTMEQGVVVGSPFVPQETQALKADSKKTEEAAKPVIASGLVIDDNGQGVPGAIVVCRTSRGRRSNSRSTVGPDDPTVICDDRGAFEIRSSDVGASLALWVALEGSYSEPIEVRPFSQGLRLRLRALAKLRGKIVAQDFAGLEDLFVVLISEQTSKRQITHLRFDNEIDVDILPGEYTLHLTEYSHGKAPILVRENITLAAGITTDLGELQLPSEGRTIDLHIDFIDSLKATFYPGLIRVYAPQGEQVIQEKRADFSEQSVRCYLKSFPADIEISVPGFRSKRLHVDQLKVKTEMRRGPIVDPVVEGINNIDPDLLVRIELSQSTLEGTVWFRAGRKAPTYLFSEGGPCRVDVLLRLGRGRSRLLALDSPTEVVIDDNLDRQTLTIRPNQESLQKILVELRSRTGRRSLRKRR